MAQNTTNSDLLIRSELWSMQLKDILEDALEAQKWVEWLTDFPDGTTLTMPSIGEATTFDYSEGDTIRYSNLDTGEFQFTINEYVGSAHSITRKLLQDSYWGPQVQAAFVPKESRAIMKRLEESIFKAPGPNASQGGQTAGSANTINGFDHRYAATGSSYIISVNDFAYAKLALRKANVPTTNLVAFVDPVSAYQLETTSNIVNISNNPMWEGIVTSGLSDGRRFIRNVFGFDVYESNFLDTLTASESINTTAHASQTAAVGFVQNLMFSATPGLLPVIGAWRQMPIVDGEFNKDKQQEEYVTTCRWGLKLKWPENMVCVLSKPEIA